MNSKLSQINSNQIKDEKFNEQWSQWKPIEGLADKYYIDGVLDTMSGFKVELSEIGKRENKISVIFEDSVDVYRSADETYRHKLIVELDEKYGTDFYAKWTFFKVENSRYLQWLSEQSYGIIDSHDMMHFSFIAGNCVLDVITNYDPIVEMVNEL